MQDTANNASAGVLKPEDQRRVLDRIDQSMAADQPRFRRRLKRLRRAPLDGAAWNRMLADLDASVARCQRRLASPITPSYPSELPIAAARSELLEALSAHQVVVICGATGSGKTTQLPKLCLELGRGGRALIGHTQPRRVAARRVATRIADELGPAHKGVIAHQVRFNSTVSDDCRVKVMTDGILLAEVQADRRLSRYDTLIIDEAHERSLNIDFLLGYLKDLLPRRADLKVIISSATIDSERFSAFFNDAPVVEVSGRMHPVTTRYEPPVSDDGDALLEAGCEAVSRLWREESGDVLVFLPGERHIRDLAGRLRGRLPSGAEILPLFARLPMAEQDKIFSTQAGRRRVVLATNVAETSLTVPGVRHVVDTGIARIARYSHRSTVQSLPVEPISRAAADQRLGRAGRLGPGICVRLFSEDDFLERPAFTEPEILRANLAAVLLRLLALGWRDVESFPFFDPPSRRHVNDGYRLLRELGALEDDDSLSDIGQRLARLPLDPRVGRMLVEASELGCLREVLVIASGLAVPDVRERLHGGEAEDEVIARAHDQFKDSRSDFMSMLRLWRYFDRGSSLNGRPLTNGRPSGETAGRGRSTRGRKPAASDEQKLFAQCRRLRVSAPRLREWQEVHAQLEDVALEVGLRMNRHSSGYARIHRALLSGLLRNVGHRNGPREYAGVRDSSFLISPGSFQSQAGHPWVVAGELVETSRLYAFRVASVRPEWVEAHAGSLLRRGHFEAHWDAELAQAMVYEQTTLYGLILVARRRVKFAPVSRPDARDIFIRAGLVEGGFQTSAGFIEANAQLVERLREFDHKLRRPDVLINDEGLYQYYDALLPADVCDGSTFEAWRRRAERANRDLLFADETDLLGDASAPQLTFEFPDVIDVAGLKLGLRYCFQPSEPEDGVTVLVPRDVIGELDPGPFEWLVPGLLSQKVEALLRALPKSIRRSVVPLPDCVSAFVQHATIAHGLADGHWPPSSSLRRALAEFIASNRGVTVPLHHWHTERINAELPPHLLMRFSVRDGAGMTIAEGRDLPEVQRRLLNADAVRGTGRARRRTVPPESYRDWAFGDLPELSEVERDGVPVLMYPTLVDRLDSVEHTLSESKEAAERQTRQGVRRLFALRTRRQTAAVIRAVPGFDDARLAYLLVPDNPDLGHWRHGQGLWGNFAAQASSDSSGRSSAGTSSAGLTGLDAELADLTVEQAFVAGRALPRTRVEFETRLAAGEGRLADTIGECAGLVSQCLEGYRQILRLRRDTAARLSALTQADLDQQVEHLFYRGFVAATPYDVLSSYPRYLKSITRRIEKARLGGARDAAKVDQFAPFWARYQTRLLSHLERGRFDPALHQYRWMLEEFRISLFTQELGTATPVSPRRLDDLWVQVSA